MIRSRFPQINGRLSRWWFMMQRWGFDFDIGIYGGDRMRFLEGGTCGEGDVGFGPFLLFQVVLKRQLLGFGCCQTVSHCNTNLLQVRQIHISPKPFISDNFLSYLIFYFCFLQKEAALNQQQIMNKYNRGETSFVVDKKYQKDRKETNNNKSAIYRTQSEKFIIPKKTPNNVNESTVSQKVSGKNLKLRDYLFLVGVNSKRSFVPVVDSPDREQEEPSTPITPSASSRCLKNPVSARSIKYEIDNRHVQSVVAKEIQEDLSVIMGLTSSIKDRLGKLLRSDQMEQEDMVKVYALRRALKEKILKELIEIDDFVKKKEGLEEMHQQLVVEAFKLQSYSFMEESQPQSMKKETPQLLIEQQQQQLVDELVRKKILMQSQVEVNLTMIHETEELLKKDEEEEDIRNSKMAKLSKKSSKFKVAS